MTGKDALVFLPLGGSGEIGMNFNAYGFGPPGEEKWIVADCGVLFGREAQTPGVDLIVPDVSFLAERGIPGSRIAVRRAAGAFLAGGVVTVLATGAAFFALLLASERFSPVRTVVGSAQELLDARYIPALCVFLLSASIFPGLASLSGWRAAYPKGK